MTTVKPVKICSTLNMSEADWLEKRKVGIGGSDAAAVVGMSPWTSPVRIYLDKIDALPEEPADPEREERFYFGHVMEDLVAREFAKRNPGLKVARSNFMYQHPEYPFMIANVDRVIVGRNCGLECKNISDYSAEGWKDDAVPDYYRLQCMHYMAVMGWEKMFIAAIVGGHSFIQREIPRDDGIIEALINAERDFWVNHVQARVAPDPVTTADAAALFPKDNGSLVDPSSLDIDTALELSGVQSQIKELKDKEEELKAVLQSRLGPASGFRGLCTWKVRAGSVSYQKMAMDELGEDRVNALKENYRGEESRTFRISLSKEFKELRRVI